MSLLVKNQNIKNKLSALQHSIQTVMFPTQCPVQWQQNWKYSLWQNLHSLCVWMGVELRPSQTQRTAGRELRQKGSLHLEWAIISLMLDLRSNGPQVKVTSVFLYLSLWLIVFSLCSDCFREVGSAMWSFWTVVITNRVCVIGLKKLSKNLRIYNI